MSPAAPPRVNSDSSSLCCSSQRCGHVGLRSRKSRYSGALPNPRESAYQPTSFLAVASEIDCRSPLAFARSPAEIAENACLTRSRSAASTSYLTIGAMMASTAWRCSAYALLAELGEGEVDRFSGTVAAGGLAAACGAGGTWAKAGKAADSVAGIRRAASAGRITAAMRECRAGAVSFRECIKSVCLSPSARRRGRRRLAVHEPCAYSRAHPRLRRIRPVACDARPALYRTRPQPLQRAGAEPGSRRRGNTATCSSRPCCRRPAIVAKRAARSRFAVRLVTAARGRQSVEMREIAGTPSCRRNPGGKH